MFHVELLGVNTHFDPLTKINKESCLVAIVLVVWVNASLHFKLLS